MKRVLTWFIISLIMIAVVSIITGCSSGPTSGYTWNKSYTPASTDYVPGFYEPYTCSGSGYSRYCSGGYWEPGHTDYNPPEWQLQVCTETQANPDKNNKCGWVDVDEHTYDSTKIGAYYGTPPNNNDGTTN